MVWWLRWLVSAVNLTWCRITWRTPLGVSVTAFTEKISWKEKDCPSKWMALSNRNLNIKFFKERAEVPAHLCLLLNQCVCRCCCCNPPLSPAPSTFLHLLNTARGLPSSQHQIRTVEASSVLWVEWQPGSLPVWHPDSHCWTAWSLSCKPI